MKGFVSAKLKITKFKSLKHWDTPTVSALQCLVLSGLESTNLVSMMAVCLHKCKVKYMNVTLGYFVICIIV